MIRTLCVVSALLLTLPSCIAAIGNRDGTTCVLPTGAVPLLQEKVAAAEQILELRQQALSTRRLLYDAARADEQSLLDAKIAVEEARIQLLQFRAELQALEASRPDHD